MRYIEGINRKSKIAFPDKQGDADKQGDGSFV